MTRGTATLTRDLPAWPATPRRHSRRYWSHLVLFTASVLLVNGLFGERGLLESRRARRASVAAGENLTRLREENEALRARARRLRGDPRAIEEAARGDLGLVGAGEILVTVRDLAQTSR